MMDGGSYENAAGSVEDCSATVMEVSTAFLSPPGTVTRTSLSDIHEKEGHFVLPIRAVASRMGSEVPKLNPRIVKRLEDPGVGELAGVREVKIGALYEKPFCRLAVWPPTMTVKPRPFPMPGGTTQVMLESEVHLCKQDLISILTTGVESKLPKYEPATVTVVPPDGGPLAKVSV